MSGGLVAPSRLCGGGVILAPIDQGVVELLLAASNDAEVTRWTQIPAGLTSVEASMVVAGWMAGTDRAARFQVMLDELAPAGLLSLWLDASGVPEVGYWLLPQARGRGVATAALHLLSEWAFDVCGFDSLDLTTLGGNLRSERVATRCGFERHDLVAREIKGERRTLVRWVRRRTSTSARAVSRAD